jgi:hypothetical protein
MMLPTNMRDLFHSPIVKLYGVATRTQSISKEWHANARQRWRSLDSRNGGSIRIGIYSFCHVVCLVHEV